MINLRLTDYMAVDSTQIEMVKVSRPAGELELQFKSGRNLVLSGTVAKEALANLKSCTAFGLFVNRLHLD